MPVQCTCAQCGATFFRSPSDLSSSPTANVYCGRACTKLGQRGRGHVRQCQHCGAAFMTNGRTRAANKFCSIKCVGAFRTTPLAEYVRARIGASFADGCRKWAGTFNKQGYGTVSAKGSGVPRALAHRVVWMLANGPIADGLEICHTCDNGALGCVELSHLFPGTHAENMADMAAKGRSLHSGKSPQAKLTPEAVVRIRSMASTMSQAEIAKVFSVAPSTISRTLSNKRWRRVA